MYVPAAFGVDEETAMAIVEAVGYGALVTDGADGLAATQLPLLVEREPLRLVGHIARSNPHWRVESRDALLIVQGARTYVSPSFYPSKAEHGRVVPTWNYEAVHLHGALSWFEDQAGLLRIVETLTKRFEQDRERPWAVSDAPSDYIDRLLGAIVGVELQVTRIEAVRKLSQNLSAADRAGVIAGLSDSSAPGDRTLAEAMRR